MVTLPPETREWGPSGVCLPGTDGLVGPMGDTVWDTASASSLQEALLTFPDQESSVVSGRV